MRTQRCALCGKDTGVPLRSAVTVYEACSDCYERLQHLNRINVPEKSFRSDRERDLDD